MNPGSHPSNPEALLRAALPTGEAAPWPAPALADLAAAFPELTLHELVGQGGMAAVYRATQARLGRAVALKVMRSDLAGQPRFGERFLREAKALASLTNPHVLTIHDFGERAGFCYLITEFVDGANLRELMRMGRLSPTEVLRIVPQICAGLHFAHQHGVVHRDIKPENVLVDRDGLVKLADFGLAKLAGEPGASTLTHTGQVFGTPHYMAPEQWQGSADVDHRADIYSLGVVLYELLTGRLPVGTYAPASAQPGVPAGVDEVVQRSLQQEPERRYQSARDVQRDLERQHAGTPSAAAAAGVATAPTDGARAANRRTGTTLFVLALVWLVLGVGGLVAFVASEQHTLATRRIAEHEDARNAHIMDSMRAVLGNGQPWTAAVPEPVDPVPGSRLGEAQGVIVTAVGGAAVVVLVMMLATAAWRHTRHVGTSRLQNVAAGFLAGLPLLSFVGAGFAWSANELAPDHGLVRFLVMLIVAGGGGWFALALWRTSADRLPGVARPMGRAAATTTLACVVLAVGLCILVTVSPRQPAWMPSTRIPIAGTKLVGASRTAVLERLGPPRTLTATPNSMIWGYRTLDGKEHSDAILLTNGTVAMGQQADALLVPEPIPANGAHAGQTVAEIVKALGPAANTASSSSGSSLSWPDGTWATISTEGVVTAVGK